MPRQDGLFVILGGALASGILRARRQAAMPVDKPGRSFTAH